MVITVYYDMGQHFYPLLKFTVSDIWLEKTTELHLVYYSFQNW